MYGTLVEAVLVHGENTPDKKAVAFKTEVVTYGELAGRIRSAAYVLQKEWDKTP